MKFGIGIAMICFCMLGGYIGVGGKLAVLWQPYEILIIMGSALGAYVVANPKSVIIDSMSATLAAVRGDTLKEQDYLELMSLLFTIFRQGKANGVMSLENDIERPVESEMFQKYPRVLA
ncbi:MAG: motility-associated protein, partial [Pseudomonadota bacterium]